MNYVNNQDFSNALRTYRDFALGEMDKGNPQPDIPKFIADCFMLIATQYASKYNFARYSFRDDMVSEAYVTCCEKVLKYDANLSPYAFSYFSRVCFRVFIDMIWNEKRESYVKAKMYITNPLESMDDEIGNDGEIDPTSNDFIPYFDVDEFEEKLAAKKEKTKLRAKELSDQRKSSTASIED
jgi:hypothetical protein